MLIFILFDAHIYRMLFLTLKKVWMVKITPQFSTTPLKKSPSKISHSPHWIEEIPSYHLMGDSLPIQPLGDRETLYSKMIVTFYVFQ